MTCIYATTSVVHGGIMVSGFQPKYDYNCQQEVLIIIIIINNVTCVQIHDGIGWEESMWPSGDGEPMIWPLTRRRIALDIGMGG
jgi:hypothetical protein